MAYDGKLLARARERLEAQRAANQTEQAARLTEVYTRIPEIQRIDAELRAQMSQLVRLTLSGEEDIRGQIQAIRDKNLADQARRIELLTEKGLPQDYLDEIYTCPKCRDSGVYDAHPCSCLEKLYNEELTRELGALMRRGDESFKCFDLSLYSDEMDHQRGTSPRDWMKRVRDICEKFALSFPNVSTNLLLHGGTGLGKTYLSACIAREVADRGYSVCYDSASAALDTFEIQKFSRSTEEGEKADVRVARMLSCDLMILDDLGTEMVTSMSLSALYTLINSRLVNKKPMIINTNLDLEDLEKHYTQQISSRLLGEFLELPFAGSDIRLLRKGK